MAKEIKVPVPDQTTEEVRIVKWIKGEGETVAKGEVILEVETDKSVMEVESIADGVLLKRLAGVDDMVAVGAAAAYIGPRGAKLADESSSLTVHGSQEEQEESGRRSAVRGQEEGTRLKASPQARKLAAKMGVDLRLVPGSGPQGRIVRDDVEKQGQSQKAKSQSEETLCHGDLGVR